MSNQIINSWPDNIYLFLKNTKKMKGKSKAYWAKKISERTYGQRTIWNNWEIKNIAINDMTNLKLEEVKAKNPRCNSNSNLSQQNIKCRLCNTVKNLLLLWKEVLLSNNSMLSLENETNVKLKLKIHQFIEDCNEKYCSRWVLKHLNIIVFLYILCI